MKKIRLPNRDYVKDLGDLMKLKDSDGWKLLVAEHQRRYDELTSKVLNPKTPSTEAETLRQARGRLEEEFLPVDILSNLIEQTRSRAQTLTNQAHKRAS
jgi:hypothetical protein